MIKLIGTLEKLVFITENAFVRNLKALPCLTSSRNLHLTPPVSKSIRQLNKRVQIVKPKQAFAMGELSSTLDAQGLENELFPDATTPEKLFYGIPYNELHILNIKSTSNNTIMSITDYNGVVLSLHSAGIEGFKNAKKGTNVAAQQAASTFAGYIRELGVQAVRLRVQGIGPGRTSSIKGFQLGGIRIVSITDDTRVSWNPPRPRKARRL